MGAESASVPAAATWSRRILGGIANELARRDVPFARLCRRDVTAGLLRRVEEPIAMLERAGFSRPRLLPSRIPLQARVMVARVD